MTEITTLLDGVTSTGSGSWVKIGGKRSRPGFKGIVHAITDSGETVTVKLEGSLDGTNAFTIASFDAAGGAQEVTLPPWVRGNLTAYTPGSPASGVSLKLEH